MYAQTFTDVSDVSDVSVLTTKQFSKSELSFSRKTASFKLQLISTNKTIFAHI